MKRVKWTTKSIKTKTQNDAMENCIVAKDKGW